ncbi:MAG: hypothetical protein R6W90_03775 [Ignavibacteriaceae bacterium]
MRNVLLTFTLGLILLSSGFTQAQSPGGKDFGFGIILGDPTGATVKFWTYPNNAFVIDVGASYFGSPRIGVDYLWHFDAFNSRIAKLYAGPGAAIGIGEGKGFWYRDSDGFLRRDDSGLGVRGVFGVNVIPETAPLEFFFEIGALIGIVPDFGSGVDAALGMRFYP